MILSPQFDFDIIVDFREVHLSSVFQFRWQSENHFLSFHSFEVEELEGEVKLLRDRKSLSARMDWSFQGNELEADGWSLVRIIEFQI